MMPARVMPAALLLAAGLAVPRPVSAQIYSWTDANGHLVLSNRPKGAAPQSFAVAGAPTPTVRVTRQAEPSRAGLYDDLIEHHASLHGIRTELVRAVIQVESGFNRFARSAKGALGLMQLMPGTAREMSVADPFNPAENIRGGVAYLRQLLDRYDQNERLALAAYNAGPGAVDRYGTALPPYRETREYVSRVASRAGDAAVAPGRQARTIYKVVEWVDGHPVARYTDRKPGAGSYEVVGTR